MLATRKPRPQAQDDDAFAPGEAPASALAVRGAHDIDTHPAGRPCPCGAYVLDPDLSTFATPNVRSRS
jgi:hypothetical protein